MKPGTSVCAAGRGLILTVLLSATAGGAEIYKWTGSDGVTHYAEAPPDVSLASLEILDVTVAGPAQPAVANYQSVLDVANSIEASRLARERARLEREKLLLQERKLAAQQAYFSGDAANGGVYYLPYYRYHRPGRPHKPLKPYPYKYGYRPAPAPHSKGGGSDGGSTQARVYLNRQGISD